MWYACPIHIALHADIARRVGSDYEHDQEGRDDLTLVLVFGARGGGHVYKDEKAVGWVSRACLETSAHCDL